MRRDGRDPGELRRVEITRGVNKHAEGSALIEMGDTRVLCMASVEDRVPPFLKDSGTGWVTAEYAMLPRSTHTRSARESKSGRIGGRTHEIQRLIGRSLRAVTDLGLIGERTVTLDCDVLQADGGTRTASICGAFVAMVEAFDGLMEAGALNAYPVLDCLAAVSLGIVGDEILLDLDYGEDSTAEVDMNLVVTGSGRLIEIQATAEGNPFTREEMDRMVGLGNEGIRVLVAKERAVLGPKHVLNVEGPA